MCMFCTVIPATATVGIALNAKQKREVKEYLEKGKTPKKEIPIMPLTFIAIGSLVAVSVATHSFLYK
jgi:hypothetical protein